MSRWTCPCGFNGGPRNIREHRFGCAVWRMMIPEATPEELELVRRLQRWHNDNVVDGRPVGDWHVECVNLEHAVMLLRQFVANQAKRP